MSKLLIEQVSKYRKEIKHEVITYGLSELISMHKSGDIKIQPEWQRLFRWSREQQSSFIESLLLEIPVPPVFFFEADDGRWELLDGLQRISTVLKFMGTEADVPPEYRADNENDWHEESKNDLQFASQLVETDYLSELNGLSFARLPASLQLNLKRFRLQIYVLKRETHPSYKYEVFKRLNTLGSKLADQEIRNCATRLLSDEFPNFLRDVAINTQFQAALALEKDEIRSARTEELALRFFAMKNYHMHFRHGVAELLTAYMEAVSTSKASFDYDQERLIFERVWKQFASASTDGRLFRPKNGGIFMPTVFEVLTLAVAFHIDEVEELAPAELLRRLETLAKEAKDEELTGAGTNSKKKTLGRITKAREWRVND